MLLRVLLMALAWTAVTGTLSAFNLLLGMAAGAAVLMVTRSPDAGRSYLRRALQLVSFAAYFTWELILSSLVVAWDVLTPRHRASPGVLAVPLDARTDLEITLLANVITLTPGTLSLDVSPDRATLYVHAMYVSDPEALKRRIKDGFERRLLELLR